jgi:fermentation-respiration switch protein FrsA (DUF1100 family)
MTRRTPSSFVFSLVFCFVAALPGSGLAQQSTPANSQDKTAEKKLKTGLWPADWVYTLADGVTTREVTFYSEGIGCYGRIFFPKGFSTTGKTPGIVLGQGWAGNHFSIEKYAARFAERGMVAMVIDYRGWGSSDGFVAQAQPTVSRGEKEPVRDDKRYTKTSN